MNMEFTSVNTSYIRYKFKLSESPDGLHDRGKVRSVHLDVSRKSLGPEALKPATTLADLQGTGGDSANDVGDLYGISCGTSTIGDLYWFINGFHVSWSVVNIPWFLGFQSFNHPRWVCCGNTAIHNYHDWGWFMALGLPHCSTPPKR